MARNGKANRATASEVRQDFAETVNRVAYSHETVVIERRGRPLVALISHRDYELFQALVRDSEDAIDAAAVAATAGEELVDFDAVVKELQEG